EALPGALLLGCTATPARLDGKGLGISHGGFFDTIISGPSIGDLIEDGFLSPVRCFAPSTQINTAGLRSRMGDFDQRQLAAAADVSVITGDAVEQSRLRAEGQSAIAFCVTVAHAENVAQAFRASGYRSACAHGGLPTQKRDRLIAGLGNGNIEILTSCEIISEGVDGTSVVCVSQLRPK